MISVKKDFGKPPVKLATDKRDELIKKCLQEKNKHNFNKSVYRDGVLEDLEHENLYNGKCAYCESDSRAAAPMQVEHYRPKKKVTEDPKNHDGYYWLGYEWSNLLLSCSKCNNKKRNQFPINGERVKEPEIGTDGLPTTDYREANSLIFREEKALLLNPEIDEVEQHFIFLPNGKIKALTPEAEKTIEVCNLNRRDLVSKRVKILNEKFDEIQACLYDFLTTKINDETLQYCLNGIFEDIMNLQNRKKEYSRFGYFMFTKFNLFFTDRLPQKQQKVVRQAFDLFLQKQL